MLKRERQLYLVQPMNLHVTAEQSNSISTELKDSADTISQYLAELSNKKN